MIITNFDSFNEGFLGIDLKKIKEEAKKFAKSKECVKIFSQIDTNTLNSTVEEVKKLKQKWGSIDVLGQKLLTKANESNEGIASVVIILSAFGIHASMKLLSALKNNQGFLEYFGRLFWSKGNMDIGRTIRDIIIMATFIIYTILYLLFNSQYTSNYYKTSNNTYINIQYKWDGITNYIFKDDVGKEYDVKKTDSDVFDILYKGKKIGTTDFDYIYDSNGQSVITDIDDDLGEKKLIKLDLEKILTGKYKYNKSTEKEINNRQKEIDNKQKEIDNLENEIDSLNTNIYENVDMAKKLFKEVGKDYDKIVNTPENEIHNLNSADKVFLYIKDILVKGNNLGYLGLFTSLIINKQGVDVYHSKDVNYWKYNLKHIYELIKENKDILSNLRNSNGELCTLFDLTNYESIEDALKRLGNWRKVNQFMRQIPATQKNLIWENGYFKNNLKNKSQFLTSCIIKIANDPDLSKTFLSKISASKTINSIIDSIYRVTNVNPWDFDYWLNKLNRTRNVYVTWSSEEEKQIICIVNTFKAIKKIAGMTNWCIARQKSYFDDYTENGFQCILYDFNYPATSNGSVIGFSLNDEKDKYKISHCYDKSDSSSAIPKKFTTYPDGVNDYYYRRLSTLIKPEYVKINLGKAALKFDNTFLKALNDKIIAPVRKVLNRPIISNFIDFYDSEND